MANLDSSEKQKVLNDYLSRAQRTKNVKKGVENDTEYMAQEKPVRTMRNKELMAKHLSQYENIMKLQPQRHTEMQNARERKQVLAKAKQRYQTDIEPCGSNELEKERLYSGGNVWQTRSEFLNTATPVSFKEEEDMLERALQLSINETSRSCPAQKNKNHNNSNYSGQMYGAYYMSPAEKREKSPDTICLDLIKDFPALQSAANARLAGVEYGGGDSSFGTSETDFSGSVESSPDLITNNSAATLDRSNSRHTDTIFSDVTSLMQSFDSSIRHCVKFDVIKNPDSESGKQNDVDLESRIAANGLKSAFEEQEASFEFEHEEERPSETNRSAESVPQLSGEQTPQLSQSYGGAKQKTPSYHSSISFNTQSSLEGIQKDTSSTKKSQTSKDPALSVKQKSCSTTVFSDATVVDFCYDKSESDQFSVRNMREPVGFVSASSVYNSMYNIPASEHSSELPDKMQSHSNTDIWRVDHEIKSKDWELVESHNQSFVHGKVPMEYLLPTESSSNYMGRSYAKTSVSPLSQNGIAKDDSYTQHCNVDLHFLDTTDESAVTSPLSDQLSLREIAKLSLNRDKHTIDSPKDSHNSFKDFKAIRNEEGIVVEQGDAENALLSNSERYRIGEEGLEVRISSKGENALDANKPTLNSKMSDNTIHHNGKGGKVEQTLSDNGKFTDCVDSESKGTKIGQQLELQNDIQVSNGVDTMLESDSKEINDNKNSKSYDPVIPPNTYRAYDMSYPMAVPGYMGYPYAAYYGYPMAQIAQNMQPTFAKDGCTTTDNDSSASSREASSVNGNETAEMQTQSAEQMGKKRDIRHQRVSQVGPCMQPNVPEVGAQMEQNKMEQPNPAGYMMPQAIPYAIHPGMFTIPPPSTDTVHGAPMSGMPRMPMHPAQIAMMQTMMYQQQCMAYMQQHMHKSTPFTDRFQQHNAKAQTSKTAKSINRQSNNRAATLHFQSNNGSDSLSFQLSRSDAAVETLTQTETHTVPVANESGVQYEQKEKCSKGVACEQMDSCLYYHPPWQLSRIFKRKATRK